jgi:2-hydroxy-3-oxopropionate reductase
MPFTVHRSHKEIRMQLGFIGLGAMGNAMALNLIKGGHAVSVWARRPEAAKPLLDAGATACASPAELAARSEAVFTMVTTTADVEQVLLGPAGVIEAARPGSVVVILATISPGATRRIGAKLAEGGVETLDAPVSGGPVGATDGTLSIMVGGKPDVFERVKPLFQCLGKTIVHLGELGAGQVTKACNQLALVVTIQAVAEALALARRAGVDPGKVREALLGGLAQSRALEVLGSRMVERDFAPGMEARLHHKDMGIVLELAHELGIPLPAAALATQQLNALIGAGGGRRDPAALIEVLERMSEVRPG